MPILMPVRQTSPSVATSIKNVASGSNKRFCGTPCPLCGRTGTDSGLINLSSNQGLAANDAPKNYNSGL